MSTSSSISFERVMASLPGWLMIFAGAAMVAMVSLVPSWIESRKLDWQLQVVSKQSQQLTQQQIAYEQFLMALREKDPVVIERLAFYHLRMKPVNLSLMDQIHSQQTASQAVVSHVWQTLPTIEDLLAQPIFKPSQVCPPGVIPDTRLVRVATGPHRYLLLGFGIVCLFFGVLPPSRETMAALAAAEAAQAEDASIATMEQDASNDTALAGEVQVHEAAVATAEMDDPDEAAPEDESQSASVLAMQTQPAEQNALLADAEITLEDSEDEQVIVAELEAEDEESSVIIAELESPQANPPASDESQTRDESKQA